MGAFEQRLRWIGIPTVAIIMSLIMGRDAWQEGGVAILGAIGKGFIFTFAIWEGNRQIMHFLYRKYPEIDQTRKRLLIELPSVFFYTIGINTGIAILLTAVFGEDMFAKADSPFLHMAAALVPTAIILSIYESMYFFESWKKHVEDTEAVARINVQSQFEALKKQLDPHFLFNCMNTLASLIDAENDQAQKYLERLSEVYRYVLDIREQSTVTIEQEITFLKAYVYLNEVRFRENLRVDQELNPELYQYRLPSLSLQLLVENAIKHNVVSRENPLTIRIYKDGNFVTVENNKQRKKTLHKSTRLGLQNIVKRYQFLTDLPVHINETESHFRVQIPILEPSVT